MIEVAKPIVRSVERSPHERRDVRRPQEAVSRDVSDDLDVVFGHPEGWRIRGSPESRSAACACV
ncbi:hypothetical protein [Methylocystis sp.]|uniref:hypothetical protein n=1 Tax=Methylocystis sp. TaxID=1911079 RepID=UPI0025D66894|nr:hypothetical protein [Methylocystis sp.]